MSEINELYQAVILDHNAKPRNWGAVDDATHHADGYNPLCGDQYRVTLKVVDDRIEEVRFEGSGCAISKASASLMTQVLKGKSRKEAEVLIEQFHHLVTSDTEVDEEALGKLTVLAGVREYPARVKCATLSWHAVKGALAGSDEAISTE